MNHVPVSSVKIHAKKCNRNYVVPKHICVFLPQVIQERRKERKTGVVKEREDLLDLLMDMYDEETGTRMDDEELRAQVIYSASYMYKPSVTEATLQARCIILHLAYLSQCP